MAKQSPFLLSKDSARHILSSHAERVGVPCNVKELRFSVNGWLSQHLIHDLVAPENVSTADLMEYFTDKGYAPFTSGSLSEKVLSRVAKSIQDSIPLYAEYIPGFGGWRFVTSLSAWTFPVAGADALAAEMRALRKDTGGFRFVAVPNNMPWAGVVPCWGVEKGADLEALLKSKGVLTISDVEKGRVVDPLTWFSKKLRAAGFPMDLFKYHGLIDATHRSGAGSAVASGPGFRLGTLYKGATKIIGPLDAFGKRPVWVGPRLSDVVVWSCDHMSLYNSTSVTTTGFECRWKTYLPNVTATKVGLAEMLTVLPASIVYPYDGYGYNFNGLIEHSESYYLRSMVTGIGGSIEQPDVKDYPVTTPLSATLPFADGTWVAETSPIGSSSLQYTNSKWKIAKPNGIIGWSYSSASYVNVGNAASTYGIDTWVASPARLSFHIAMAKVREYLQEQSLRTDISAADKAKLTSALKKSADYIDAVISTTVSSEQAVPASLLQVQSLRMVAESKKGDVDLMTEDLGDGITLTVLGKKIDADRAKGKRYSSFSIVVDEAATVGAMISTRVEATLGTAYLWNLSATQALDGSTVVKGSYNGGELEVLTDVETALLMLAGAVSKNGSVTDATIATDLGLGASWRADLTALGTTNLISSGSDRSSWTSTAVAWDKFSPSNFTDISGYPVVGYTDADTVVRQQLLYKGNKSDPADLACALFFSNQVDFVGA